MDYSGFKVLVMGLGLHGGGLETARFLLKRGASLTVTDLRDEKTLLPAIEQLDAACIEYGQEKIKYILGRHEIEDFKNADIVIKNPAVRPDSQYLQAAKKTETDISLFLSESPAKLFAVTGSKGKSSTASALFHILEKYSNGKTFLGGNITVSPLSFIDNLGNNDNVVLELSSFQLGDLKGRKTSDGNALLKPAASILTTIMPDHLDRYVSMEEYVDDKRNIYRGQDSRDVTIAGNCPWGNSFLSETRARPIIYSPFLLGKNQSGGWLENGKGYAHFLNWEEITEETVELVPQKLIVKGSHQKLNLLAAALAAYANRVEAENIKKALADFRGIEHRLELFLEVNGMCFYNDSAATIPQAATACIEALNSDTPLVLVTGGTDKNLDFSTLAKAALGAQAVILLAGTGSEKLAPLLTQACIKYFGPFDDLDKAVLCAIEKAENIKNKADGCVSIALSPGCASFGMFLNEFDRGKKWKEAVLRLYRR